MEKKKYPFDESNVYYTIEDNLIIASIWDDVSEELFTEDTLYFRTLEDAINHLKEILP